jgi:hypothetical protein
MPHASNRSSEQKKTPSAATDGVHSRQNVYRSAHDLRIVPHTAQISLHFRHTTWSLPHMSHGPSPTGGDGDSADPGDESITRNRAPDPAPAVNA